jgi:hypothetical protein
LLTARELGAHMLHVVELDQCFQDSSKHMTRYVESDVDSAVSAMHKFVKEYESGREHNKTHVARTCAAITALVDTEMTQEQQLDREHVFPLPLPFYAQTEGGLKMLGVQGGATRESTQQALELLHKRKALTHDAATTHAAIECSDDVSSSASSVLCKRSRKKLDDQALTFLEPSHTEAITPEKLARIRTKFRRNVADYFALLECVYSPETRESFVDIATKTGANAIASLEARTLRQTIFYRAINYTDALAEFDKATHACIVGMEAVIEMNRWTPWTSGKFRTEKSAQLVERMLRIWEVVVHSPAMTEPCLFGTIGTVLLDIAITGLTFTVCLHVDQHAQPPIPYVQSVCSVACTHKRLEVKFVEEDKTMCEITTAPGIALLLEQGRQARLAGRNTTLKLYKSLLQKRIRLADLARFLVKA